MVVSKLHHFCIILVTISVSVRQRRLQIVQQLLGLGGLFFRIGFLEHVLQRGKDQADIAVELFAGHAHHASLLSKDIDG